jgi:hypothetical protein
MELVFSVKCKIYQKIYWTLENNMLNNSVLSDLLLKISTINSSILLKQTALYSTWEGNNFSPIFWFYFTIILHNFHCNYWNFNWSTSVLLYAVITKLVKSKCILPYWQQKLRGTKQDQRINNILVFAQRSPRGGKSSLKYFLSSNLLGEGLCLGSIWTQCRATITIFFTNSASLLSLVA